MTVYRSLADMPRPMHGVSLTIGNFDGVHLGHQGVIRRARQLAASSAGVVVMTFDPPPLAVLRPRQAPKLLTPLGYKLELIEQLGADCVVVLDSRGGLLTMEPRQFVEDVLIARFHPRHIVEGENFRFGAGRRGTPEMLEAFGLEFDFAVLIVPPVQAGAMRPGPAVTAINVSSSAIRSLLIEGHVEHAAICLGRPYRLFGGVVRGKGLGRQLGFPTINLDVADQVIPADGVYAGRAVIGADEHAAAISIGSSPTFGPGRRAVEGYLLDFDKDVYGQEVCLEFVERIRGQVKFDSGQALIEEMDRDVRKVRDILATA